MAQSRASLASVKEWKRKSTQLYDASNDSLVSLLSRGFESMGFLLSENADPNHIQRSLLNLDSERKNSIQFEDSSSETVRNVTYGFVESVHSTFLHLTEKINSLQEENEILKALLDLHRKNDEIPNSDPSLAMVAKDEPIDDSHMNHDNNQVAIPNYPDAGMAFKEEDMLDEDMKFEVKDENIEMDNSLNDPPANREMSTFGSMENDMPLLEMISGNFEVDDSHNVAGDVDGTAQAENSLETTQMEQRKRSSRMKFKNSMWDPDENERSVVKRNKISFGSSSGDLDSGMKIAKRNDTELECHLCEYRTNAVHSWSMHLSRKHSTSLSSEGRALRCDCGHESFSKFHFTRCNSTNVTVIKKTPGPPTTPQCIMCEKYPGTVASYAIHLSKQHQTSLTKKGIYLTCECGYVFRYCNALTMAPHKECDSRQFTLHEVNDKE